MTKIRDILRNPNTTFAEKTSDIIKHFKHLIIRRQVDKEMQKESFWSQDKSEIVIATNKDYVKLLDKISNKNLSTQQTCDILNAIVTAISNKDLKIDSTRYSSKGMPIHLCIANRIVQMERRDYDSYEQYYKAAKMFAGYLIPLAKNGVDITARDKDGVTFSSYIHWAEDSPRSVAISAYSAALNEMQTHEEKSASK